MHIINDSRSLNEVLLILEPSEAVQLIGYVKQLLEIDSSNVHFHLNDASYQKEITLCLVKDQDFTSFHPSIRAIVAQNE